MNKHYAKIWTLTAGAVIGIVTAVSIFAAPAPKEQFIPMLTFKTGPARLLFQMPATPTPAGPSYDVSHDGQRFLVNTLVTDPTPSPLTLVLNWTAEVKRD